MVKFFFKTFSILAIVVMIFGYNAILALRSDADQISRLKYELELADLKIQTMEMQVAGGSGEEGGGLHEDGIYTGTAAGYAGEIRVEVCMEKDQITQIDVVSAPNEDAVYMLLAESVIEKIIDTQSTEVDAVSGATFSSEGIIQAVADAIAQEAQ